MSMRMSHEDFLILLQECDDKSELLSNLNEKHELNKFSCRNCPVGMFDEMHLKLVRHYIRGEEKRTEKPTIEMVVAALGAYHYDLETAIDMEHVRNI